MTKILQVAARTRCTEAEGPFRRFALWVQGCSLACPGCCNPELFSRRGGDELGVDNLLHEIADAKAQLGIEGLTLVGGEPLEQLPSITTLCRGVHKLGLGVIVFTGFTLKQASQRSGSGKLWPLIDTLVAGPFEARRQAGAPRYVGSANQELHHLSPRYAAPELWHPGKRAEIQVSANGQLRLVGAPVLTRRLGRRL